MRHSEIFEMIHCFQDYGQRLLEDTLPPISHRMRRSGEADEGRGRKGVRDGGGEMVGVRETEEGRGVQRACATLAHYLPKPSCLKLPSLQAATNRGVLLRVFWGHFTACPLILIPFPSKFPFRWLPILQGCLARLCTPFLRPVARDTAEVIHCLRTKYHSPPPPFPSLLLLVLMWSADPFFRSLFRKVFAHSACAPCLQRGDGA